VKTFSDARAIHLFVLHQALRGAIELGIKVPSMRFLTEPCAARLAAEILAIVDAMVPPPATGDPRTFN
jgi:hypothetical protein